MGKFSTFYIDVLFIFSQSVENWKTKLSNKKHVGVTDHPKGLNLSKVYPKPTSPLDFLFFALRVRVHDVGWHCNMNGVRSKTVHIKQLTRTSLRPLPSTPLRNSSSASYFPLKCCCDQRTKDISFWSIGS